LIACILWGATLFFLSATNKPLPDTGFEIPHIDKVLHFGYFFGGGIIIAIHILLKRGAEAHGFLRFALPVVILAVVGALDEYHQTFTPGRSGNDPFDWLADVLGASAGVVLASRIYPLLMKFPSPGARFAKNSVQ
jgi:VanZ family protein